MLNSKNKIIFSYLFIIILGLMFFTLTIKGVGGNPAPEAIKDNLDQISKPFELAPERSKYIHTVSLSERGTYALDSDLSSIIREDVIVHDGKGFNYFAPGISYAAVPFYKLGKLVNLSQILTFSFIAFVTLFAGLLIYKISREIYELPNSISVLNSLFFLFATTSWSYATTLYDHNVTAFFVLLAFYSIWKYKKDETYKSGFWSILVWSSYAFAIFIDYMNLLLFLPLMVYFIIVSFKVTKTAEKIRFSFRLSLLTGIIFFIVIFGLHAYHNQKYFGEWNNTILNLPRSEFGQNVNTNQYSLTEQTLPLSFNTLTFAMDRGLFVYVPILFLGFLGLFRNKSKNFEDVILLSFIITNLFIFSSSTDPWGGWGYGPRHLIPSMAILSIFIGRFLVYTKYKALSRPIVFVLFLYSSAVALLGVLTTNGVPPKVESIYLGIKYNYLRNFDLLLNNESSSFIYNNYFSNLISLSTYFILIYAVLVSVIFYLIFLVKEKYDIS